jgi:tRNA A58 N-methylase Trm61
VAGDQDYLPTLERCLKKGWKVEIYFWEQVSQTLKNLSGSQFINLNAWFKKITFLQNSLE